MGRRVGLLLIGGCVLGALPLAAQPPARPVPGAPSESPGFREAVARGTRTRTGQPGPHYWQQYARYDLAARLDPDTRELQGEGTVVYLNRSPDTLATVHFQLHQNLFAPGQVRNRVVPVTGGMRLHRVAAGGVDLAEGPGYQVTGTTMAVRLPAPLQPGDSARFALAWSFRVPPDGGPRGGDDGEVLFLSYWYPQLAVYDDLSGWHLDPYMGNAEFHMGFADYRVAISVPAGWLIGSTGTLRNPEEVLSARTRERLARAAMGGDPVPVVAESERGAGQATTAGTDGRLVWRFAADGVRDFAFGTSPHYVWDATIASAGDRDGDRVHERSLIHTLYRPSRRAWAWDQAAFYARHSIAFLSQLLWPYPWDQATAVDGPTSCSGMEYPMITCIGGSRDTLSLYSVTVHELAHMWFPMQVASDEKRHAWQDEGFTRYNQALGMRDYFRGYDREALTRESYLAFARTGAEVELMRHGDQYPVGSRAFGIASYDKMATNLATLRGLIGEQRFLAALREYGAAWRGRHPAPWDFFHTVNRVAGTDLWWFWRTWWYETWTLEQAVATVRVHGDSSTIVIEDRGLAPMPVRLAVRRPTGGTNRYEIPVEVWLSGATRYEFTVRFPVASVEIDPEGLFPDLDRTNNLWRALDRPGVQRP